MIDFIFRAVGIYEDKEIHPYIVGHSILLHDTNLNLTIFQIKLIKFYKFNLKYR